MNERRWRIGAASTVALATLLRLLHLGRTGLGNDEIAEVMWSRLPWHAMVAEVVRDGVHPPLDYVMQFALVRMSSAELIWRLPRALAGAATVAIVIALAARWTTRGGALVAGLILAASPIHIRFSQEIRPYAFGLLWLALALLLLEQRRFVLWFIAVLAAAATLYFAGMIAALASVAAVYSEKIDPLRKRMPLVVLGWALIYLPWLPTVLGVAHAPPPVPREPLVPAWFAYRLETLGTGDWRPDPVSAGSWAFWALVLIGIACSKRIAPIVWSVAGFAIEIAILQMRPHFPGVRHLLPSWIGAVVLAGIAAGILFRRRWGAVLVGVALLLIAVFDGRTLRAYYHLARPEWHKVARFVGRSIRPGERVVVANDWTARNFGWYWTRVPRNFPVTMEMIGANPARVDGPAWLVISECRVAPEAATPLQSIPLAADFDLTNHCSVRYVPEGRVLEVPRLCE